MTTEEVILIENREISADEFVSVKDAAKILSISDRTVRRMIHKGELPIYRISEHTIRILVHDILDYCNQRRCDAVC